MSSSEYNSEGFDLDAMPATSQGGEEVIYEIGGGATTVIPPPSQEQQEQKQQQQQQSKEDKEEEESPINNSEEFKRRGNDHFKKGDYLNAYDLYSDAIGACPGITGEEIMNLKSDHEMQEREKANQRYLRDTDRKRNTKTKPQLHPTISKDEGSKIVEEDGDSGDSGDDENNSNDNDDDDLAPSEFKIPTHEYGTQLAVYYSNRAACLLHDCRYDEAIQDCEIAILLNPKYTKAYIRRMTAYEKTERSEEALRDAKEAMNLDPQNREIRKHVDRLQKVENERMEKLKEETMGKLKDLGNSILGNFGLSLDNFKAQQDPSTGSYNISFQN